MVQEGAGSSPVFHPKVSPREIEGFCHYYYKIMRKQIFIGLHPEDNLTNKQRELVINWANNHINYLKENFPEDSLVFRRK